MQCKIVERIRNYQFELFGCIAIAASGIPLDSQASQAVELILHNGYVFTADDMLTVQSAVAIDSDEIVAVGTQELLDNYTAEKTVDLQGKLVVPGFNDTHIHIRGNPPWYVDLETARSIEDIQSAIAKKASELPERHWITGYGWAEGLIAEGRAPNRFDLDAAVPHHPVVLSRAGGHSLVANSLALSLANITKASPDPEGGVFERDTDGELTGIIRERLDLFATLVPQAEQDELVPDLVRNLKGLLELGVTSIILAGVSPDIYKMWESVYTGHKGELPRVAVQIFPGLAKGGASVDSALESLAQVGRISGEGDHWFRVGAVKLWVDGGFAGPAAWTLESYRNQQDYYGIQNIESNDLHEFISSAHQSGWQLGLHTIGDAAIELAVEALDQVARESPRQGARHYLNHFTVVPPEKTMQTMAVRNIAIAQQPNFTWSPTLESRYVENLEGERLAHNNPLRTPMKFGIFVALGSDNHPIGPMQGLYASVTRRGYSGRYYAPEEGLTMPEAIVAYTRNGAYLTFEEQVKGTIEAGKLADLAVLSINLVTAPVDEILETRVLMTILGGKIVFNQMN